MQEYCKISSKFPHLCSNNPSKNGRKSSGLTDPSSNDGSTVFASKWRC